MNKDKKSITYAALADFIGTTKSSDVNEPAGVDATNAETTLDSVANEEESDNEASIEVLATNVDEMTLTFDETAPEAGK